MPPRKDSRRHRADAVARCVHHLDTERRHRPREWGCAPPPDCPTDLARTRLSPLAQPRPTRSAATFLTIKPSRRSIRRTRSRMAGSAVADGDPACGAHHRSGRRRLGNHVGLADEGFPATAVRRRSANLRKCRAAHSLSPHPIHPGMWPAKLSTSVRSRPTTGSFATDLGLAFARSTPMRYGISSWPPTRTATVHR